MRGKLKSAAPVFVTLRVALLEHSFMSNDASFVGGIPEHYDCGLGPVVFMDFAADIARRVAAYSPPRVLETAAGTGIVTRQLRDLSPAGARLTATDLNPPMLEVARQRFRADEL